MEITGKYTGKLTKISSTHINLRTNDVVGVFEELPEVGQAFEIISEPFDPGMDYRQIITTLIESCVMNDNKFRFKTKNSEYELEVFSQEAKNVLDKQDNLL